MDLQSIVQVYIRNTRPRKTDELNWYREQPDLRSAIELAAFAINREGKRHAHQRRLKRTSLENAREILINNIEAIERVKGFDELINLVDALLAPVTGVGELYFYDTSLRIGAWLNLFPKKVYLHAGARMGAKAIGFSVEEKFIDLKSLPTEFQVLELYEAEDILCIFNDKYDKSIRLNLE